MCEIVETRSILGTGIRQRMAGTGFAPNSHGRSVWFFTHTSLNIKVKGQRSRSPGTKNALCSPNTPAVLTEWNVLVADNVAQAANATSRSLVRGVFAGLRSECGVRWAWRAIAGLCHAFLVLAFLSNTDYAVNSSL